MSPADPVSRPAPLAPKIVAEVRELHERSVEAAREARGRRGRRERREAREAENDVLRALGFAGYGAFVAFVDGVESEPGETAHEAPELSLVESAEPPPLALDAQQTEAALLRVLRSEGRTPPRAVDRPDREPDASPADQQSRNDLVEDLHARVAAFEEELAEARFELRRVRDELRVHQEATATPEGPDLSGAVREAASGLALAAAELQSLSEFLRGERGELAALGVSARAEAEQILDAARADAQREREEAAAEARVVLDKARADAVALTRNAISTVDGLRQIAAEERDTPNPDS
jgi:hypothetical protein